MVSLAQHDQRGQQILGNALRRNTANRIKCLPTQDAARATTKCRLPRITGGGHLVKKQALLIGLNLHEAQIDLNGILVVKVLWCLHDADCGVAEKTQRALDKVSRWHKVRIKNRNKLPFCMR